MNGTWWLFRAGRVVCWWRPAVAVPGGKWIPYTAAQVARHHAMRLVCVVLGGLAGGAPVSAPPLRSPAIATPYFPGQPFVPIAFELPQGFPGDVFLPNLFGTPAALSVGPFFGSPGASTAPVTATGSLFNSPFGAPSELNRTGMHTPEPASIFLLLFGLGVLVAVNEGRRNAMSNRLKHWPPGSRQIEPLTEDDDLKPSRGVIFGIAISVAVWIIIVVALIFLPAWSWRLL